MPAKFPTPLCAALLILAALACSVSAQIRLFGPKPTPQNPAPQTIRKASDLIRRQEPVKINQSLLKEATPDNVHVVVSLPKQRAFLMIGEQIVIDSPISSGKRGTLRPRAISVCWKKIRTIVPTFMATLLTAPAALSAQASAPKSMLRPAEHIMLAHR